jgi:ATP-dependent RNA helicase DDX56/DBP9
MAFGIPLIQTVLNDLGQEEAQQGGAGAARGIRGLVLVPTKELCDQVARELKKLLRYCRDSVAVVAVSSSASRAAQAPRLLEGPEVVVCTPGRLVEHLTSGVVVLKKSLKFLAIDEADLVLSFGSDAAFSFFAKLWPALSVC